MSAIMRRRRSLIGLSRIGGSCPEVGGVGTPNPQDGTPAPSSSVDQLVGAILAACSSPARAGSFNAPLPSFSAPAKLTQRREERLETSFKIRHGECRFGTTRAAAKKDRPLNPLSRGVSVSLLP